MKPRSTVESLNRSIEREEFARVHVDDGSRPEQSGSSRAPIPPTYADEPWPSHRPGAG